MNVLLRPLALLSLLLSGAIFGFFYAWVCSTMWGLDAAPPTVAIAAMKAMNASVRNAVFAPAFFGTPFVLFLTAAVAARAHRRKAAVFFASGGLVYLFGGILLTMRVNVPMNEAFALIAVPANEAEATRIWQTYSGSWQKWNIARTFASALTLMLTGMALLNINRTSP
jgi:uncharacterized membrane protein